MSALRPGSRRPLAARAPGRAGALKIVPAICDLETSAVGWLA